MGREGPALPCPALLPAEGPSKRPVCSLTGTASSPSPLPPPWAQQLAWARGGHILLPTSVPPTPVAPGTAVCQEATSPELTLPAPGALADLAHTQATPPPLACSMPSEGRGLAARGLCRLPPTQGCWETHLRGGWRVGGSPASRPQTTRTPSYQRGARVQSTVR